MARNRAQSAAVPASGARRVSGFSRGPPRPLGAGDLGPHRQQLGGRLAPCAGHPTRGHGPLRVPKVPDPPLRALRVAPSRRTPARQVREDLRAHRAGELSPRPARLHRTDACVGSRLCRPPPLLPPTLFDIGRCRAGAGVRPFRPPTQVFGRAPPLSSLLSTAGL